MDPFSVPGWLQAAIADAERRGLPGLRPLLEALARSTQDLRDADRAARDAADDPKGARHG